MPLLLSIKPEGQQGHSDPRNLELRIGKPLSFNRSFRLRSYEVALFGFGVEFSSRESSVPRFSARSFIMTKKTGKRMRTWMVKVIIPPTMGAAIGFITSEPMPDSHR